MKPHRSKIQFWDGRHFVLFSGAFLLGIALFSVLPGFFAPLWTWGLLLLAICVTIVFRSTLGVVGGVWLLLSLLCVQYEYHEYQSIKADIFHKQNLRLVEVVGLITDVGAVSDAWSRSTIELDDGTRYITYLPSTPSTLLWKKVHLLNPEFKEPSLFEFSRWLNWSIRFNEIKPLHGGIPYQYAAKLRLIQLIQTLFPHPESALLNGILIGDDSLMDSEFNSIYRWIGLSHITVVSGSNISAILAILVLCLKRAPKYLTVLLSIWILWIYVAFVWAEPPVIRAFLTGSITMIALTYGNKIHGTRVLLFTACILVSISPYSLLYDPGFELSFLATIGILTSVRLLKDLHVIWQAVGISVFAGVWTLPVTVGLFWSIHLWSIPANILVWPAVAWSMLLGGVSLATYPISSTIGLFAGHLAYYCLAWIDIVARTLFTFPGYYQPDPNHAFVIWFVAAWIIIGFSLRYLRLPNTFVGSSSPSGQE